MGRLCPAGLLATLAFLVHIAWAQKATLQGNDCTAAGAYTLCQNLWGADTGVGSQTTTLLSFSGDSVSWSTTYQWSQSPDNVKSYPNVNHNTAKGMQLQDIVTAPTSWQWTYQSASSDLRADVSYDIWTGVPQSGDPASAASSYEIMIWLSDRGGVGGIGNVVAPNIKIGGHTWNLKYGPNSNWNVFSFITAEGDITDFDADLNDFFQYLINNQGVAKTQYLQAIQTGTEPFTGSANLVINNFSVSVSTAEDQPSPSPSPSPSPTPTQASSSSGGSNTGKSGGPSSASSATGGNASSSKDSSSTPTSAQSTEPPVIQTTDTPVEAGIRKAGGPQCFLRPPGQNLTKRRTKRSWFARLFT
ncbi:concanavalin A-like lectin/glucanase domain-containing protein [Cubamyces lactineus]|nr:concanavalin A-like lectin/glucanase domain-containing protein [Cubamyces lactineus]